jgi:hypothetical protein
MRRPSRAFQQMRHGLHGQPRHFARIVAVTRGLVEYRGHEPTELRGRVNVGRHGFVLGFARLSATKKSTVYPMPASAASTAKPNVTAAIMTISFVMAGSSLALPVQVVGKHR